MEKNTDLQKVKIILADPIQEHNLFTKFNIKYILLRDLADEFPCLKTRKELRNLLKDLEVETQKVELKMKQMQTTIKLLNSV